MQWALDVGEVHVWSVALDHEGGCYDRLSSELSPDERDRADRFHFAIDRARFIAARAALRRILGRYLGEPRNVRLSYGARGKPFLADASIQFNLAHAEDQALIAVSEGRAVGVDMEKIAPLKETGLAAAVFSAHEVEILNALPEPARMGAFYTGWTRKEAYIKARGEGLALPLPSVDLGLGRDKITFEDENRGRWTIAPVEVPRGFAGALAVEGEDFAVSYNALHWPCGCAMGPLPK
jgi:4'-phosphopantetheinyl transferase